MDILAKNSVKSNRMAFIFNIDNRNLSFLQNFQLSDYIIKDNCLYSGSCTLAAAAVASQMKSNME